MRAGYNRRSAEVRRVRDLLRSELNSGGFTDGRLPSEEKLMEDFFASRSVIREALELLRSEELVDRVRGVGTVVLRRQFAVDLGEHHGVVDPEPGSMWSGRMWAHLIDWRTVAMPETAARHLDIATGDPGLRIEYVGWFEGEPLFVATNYVRSPEAAALDRAEFRTDWYALLDSADLKIGETSFRMEAVIADAHVAALLRVECGSPIMLSEQVIYGPDGSGFDYALIHGRGDRTPILSRKRRSPA